MPSKTQSEAMSLMADYRALLCQALRVRGDAPKPSRCCDLTVRQAIENTMAIAMRAEPGTSEEQEAGVEAGNVVAFPVPIRFDAGIMRLRTEEGDMVSLRLTGPQLSAVSAVLGLNAAKRGAAVDVDSFPDRELEAIILPALRWLR